MKNWLSIRNGSPPAKAHGTALASRAEFDRKIAQFRRAAGVLESCRIGFVCGKNGQRFEALFERAGPAEQFTVAAIEKMTCSCSAVQSGKVQAQRRIDMDDFDLSKGRCPGCGVNDFIHCGVCGQNICASCSTRKDGGGRRVILFETWYQLFFSAPAIYLVVWKPREGPQQGFVKEWITLVKHRAPEAKILVVASHGGPRQRQPDIDRQEIWDLFGKALVVDFLLVDSKPDKNGRRKGIAELRQAIAHVAASLPEMGGARFQSAGRRPATPWRKPAMPTYL